MHAPVTSNRAGSMQCQPRLLPPVSPPANQVPWRSFVYPPGYPPRDWRNDQAIVRAHDGSWQCHDPNAGDAHQENYAVMYPVLSLYQDQNNECANYGIPDKIAISLSHSHNSDKVKHSQSNG